MDALTKLLNELGAAWWASMWEAVWQSAVLAGVVYALTRARGLPASVRFWLWMLVPLRLLVMPLLRVPLPVLEGAPARTVAGGAQGYLGASGSGAVVPELVDGSAAMVPGAVAGVAGAPAAAGAAGSGVAEGLAPPSLAAVVMVVWIAGVAAGAVRLWLAWRRVHAVAARARLAEDQDLLGAMHEACAELGVRRRPRLLITGASVSPFVHGVLRPVVVLPQRALRDLGGVELSVVLWHELAHLRRLDTLSGWVVAVCRVLYFFHPVVHVAERFLRLERESACDEAVLCRRGMAPGEYARALVDASAALRTLGRVPNLCAVSAESFAQLKRRLERLGRGPARAEGTRAPFVAALVVFSAAALPGVRLTSRGAPGESGGPGELRTIMVRVVDGLDRPVEGAGIEVLSDFRPIAWGRSDGAGRASVTVRGGAVVQWIVGLKAFVGMDYYEAYPPFGPEVAFFRVEPAPPGIAARDLPDGIELRLDGARTLRFGVTDTEDAPVTGLRVSPWLIFREDKRHPVNLSGSLLASMETRSEPRLAGLGWFEWIPLDARAVAGGTFLAESDDWCWARPPEDLYPGSEDRQMRAIVERKSLVRGTVLTADGAPAPGAWVRAEGRGATINYGTDEVVTDARGCFELRLPPGQVYSVTALRDETIAVREGVAVAAGAPAGELQLRLAPGVLLRGRVGSEGAALTDHLVRLVRLGGEPGAGEDMPGMWLQHPRAVALREAVTDARGEYSFWVAPGEYLVFTSADSDAALLESEPDLNARRRFHRAEPVMIGVDAGAEVRVDIPAGGARPPLRFSGPVKATDEGLRTYFTHPASSDPSEACAQCHIRQPQTPRRVFDGEG